MMLLLVASLAFAQTEGGTSGGGGEEVTPEASYEAPAEAPAAEGDPASPEPDASSNEPQVWVGGGLGGAVGYADKAVEGEVHSEVDFRFGWRKSFVRLDLDLNYDPVNKELIYAAPEWAMASTQLGPLIVRGGLFSPNVGLEDWDRWNNYLPSYSVGFNAASVGRVLGVELAGDVGDVQIAGAIGSDIDFNSPAQSFYVGMSVWTERDTWSTWSGLYVYPLDGWLESQLSFEWYPHDLFWISLDTCMGLSGKTPWASGQLVLNVAPEWYVQPVVRGEYVYDPNHEVLGGWEAGIPDATASVGLRVAPHELVQIQLEGKGLFADNRFIPGFYASVELFRPEPGYYSANPDE